MVHVHGVELCVLLSSSANDASSESISNWMQRWQMPQLKFRKLERLVMQSVMVESVAADVRHA